MAQKSQNISVIRRKDKLLRFDFSELWRNKDLLLLFVRREIVVVYKQTILGPLWFFIQPLLTAIMFTFVFGNIAGIPTDGIPNILFYLAGVTVWNYFAECIKITSDTFKKNSAIFGKVYFPRILMPLSTVIAELIKFSIQFVLFLGVLYYFVTRGSAIHPNLCVILLPVYVLLVAGLSLGFGMIISALTTKYRDLSFLIQFGIQLWMYATPIIYPISRVPVKYSWIILANPMTAIIEAFKYSFLGIGDFNILRLTYSFIFMITILSSGMIVFNRIEKNFMDTV